MPERASPWVGGALAPEFRLRHPAKSKNPPRREQRRASSLHRKRTMLEKALELPNQRHLIGSRVHGQLLRSLRRGSWQRLDLRLKVRQQLDVSREILQ